MTSENICCDEGLLEFGFVLLKCFKILHFKKLNNNAPFKKQYPS